MNKPNRCLLKVGVSFMMLFLCFLATSLTPACHAWVGSNGRVHRQVSGQVLRVYAEKTRKQRRSSLLQPSSGSAAPSVDDEGPAGIGGAEFFGGNKEKIEFFDPQAEAEAASLSGVLTMPDKGSLVAPGQSAEDDFLLFDRFSIPEAFPTEMASDIAKDLQMQINSILYEEDAGAARMTEYKYSNNLQWETSFSKTTSNPLTELQKSLDFYRRVDVAVMSCKECSNSENESVFEVRFESAVTWPTFWEPRVLLTGSSRITINKATKEITKQVDTLDEGNSNLVTSIARQIIPRFWDVYHIGMTPSAELSPQLKLSSIEDKKSLLSSYKVYEIPPRLYLRPTLMDSGDKENRLNSNAAFVPNHAFSCVIKTMGPQRQRYSTASPVMVQITPQKESSLLELSWNIPLAVEYASNRLLNRPPRDTDSNFGTDVQGCEYVWQTRRVMATLPFKGGSSPQDESIVEMRKKLYEQVTNDGFQPKLDSSGRPQFYFIQNAIKACYTEEGLGMSVYEWRPQLASPNEVGIELEVDETSDKIVVS